jgi:hypothetical protein
MLGDLDMLQAAKEAPSFRRLSVELSGARGHPQQDPMGASNTTSGSRDIPSLRRLSTSSVASSTPRSSLSTDGSGLSPTFSTSLPNSFYLDRVSSLLGRASSLPQDRGVLSPTGAAALPGLPTIPATTSVATSPASGRPLGMVGSAPVGGGVGEPGHTRVSALIRSLSKGMDSFR